MACRHDRVAGASILGGVQLEGCGRGAASPHAYPTAHAAFAPTHRVALLVQSESRFADGTSIDAHPAAGALVGDTALGHELEHPDPVAVPAVLRWQQRV